MPPREDPASDSGTAENVVLDEPPLFATLTGKVVESESDSHAGCIIITIFIFVYCERVGCGYVSR